MKLESFQIVYDNPRGVFTAGERVKGQVVIKLQKPMKMRGIVLYFEGRAKSHWEVKHGRSKTDYRANETYLNHTIHIYGNGNETTEHPNGIHSYPFELSLAPTLPSSFEGRRGYVRYFCKATIKRPWKFDEHTKRPFTVLHHMDLNNIPNALMPIHGAHEETIEGCCWSVGHVQASMSLNKTGFVPGEPMIYTIEINNKADRTVDRLELELRQVVTYTGYSDSLFSSGHPKHHTKTDYFSLFSSQCHLKKNQDERINRATAVPALPPSKLEGCNIIDIAYFVVLKVTVGWSTFNIEGKILIGTIPASVAGPPLMGPPSFPTDLPMGGSPAVPPMGGMLPPSAPSAPPMEPPLYSDLPPSYEESVFGRVDIRDENDDNHTTGLNTWAPAYPYYNWSAPGVITLQPAPPTPSSPFFPPQEPPPQYHQLPPFQPPQPNQL